jgi:uncharacterized damage-inducible protein DinB
MDAAAQPSLSVAGFLPWINMVLDYTDEIAALIPEDKVDWRPEDPSGHFSFSLGEIAMHIADARRMFARQLSGVDSEEGYWSEGPDERGVWKFQPSAGKAKILHSMAEARRELKPFIDMPASSYTQTTDGSRQTFEKSLERLREAGQPTAEAEARGPANIVRVLMAVIAHEAGHRGALQTLLRMQGVNLKPE